MPTNSIHSSLLLIDTTPGGNSAFSPPVDFDGDVDAYLHLMRVRWATDIGATQEIAIVGKFVENHTNCANPPEFFGPFAEAAKRIASLCWNARTSA